MVSLQFPSTCLIIKIIKRKLKTHSKITQVQALLILCFAHNDGCIIISRAFPIQWALIRRVHWWILWTVPVLAELLAVGEGPQNPKCSRRMYVGCECLLFDDISLTIFKKLSLSTPKLCFCNPGLLTHWIIHSWKEKRRRLFLHSCKCPGYKRDISALQIRIELRENLSWNDPWFLFYYNLKLVNGAICIGHNIAMYWFVKPLFVVTILVPPILQHISNDVGHIFVDGKVWIQIFLFDVVGWILIFLFVKNLQ